MTTPCTTTQCQTPVRTETQTLTPRANIYDEGEKVYLELEVPGVKKQDIHLRVEGNELQVEAKRYLPSEGETPEPHFQYRRTFKLASHLDTENIVAHHENGLLRLELTRKETGRIIPVA